MQLTDNTLLFYGGLLVAALSIAVMIILLIGFHVKRKKLESKLSDEYGKKEK